jgi:hypothetical protein
MIAAVTTSDPPVGGPGPARLIAQTLDRFTASAAVAEGARPADLAPSDVLEVRTRNTCSLISTIGLRDPRVVVMGGTFFPLLREAHLVGSTLGGSAVKLGWVGRGFCLELPRDGQRVVTARVRGIRVIAGSGLLH